MRVFCCVSNVETDLSIYLAFGIIDTALNPRASSGDDDHGDLYLNYRLPISDSRGES